MPDAFFSKGVFTYVAFRQFESNPFPLGAVGFGPVRTQKSHSEVDQNNPLSEVVLVHFQVNFSTFQLQ